MARSGGGVRRSSTQTKERLITAAGEILREEGYTGASARAIATRAEANSALVFYHFGGVDQLLLAALDRSSTERMAMYRELAGQARNLEELVEVATRIYRTDLERGYLAEFSELVAAAVTEPELREEINRRSQPWIDFIAGEWERVLGGSPLGMLLPAREVAYAAIAFYLGVNLFSVLDEDRSRTEAVFDLAGTLAPRAKLLTLRLPGRGAKTKEDQ
ncbi:TetR family transcriptional regulator [Nocardiopsis terrae]|uniref:AcrR family transcriptional regulator n=1 Tax=Nocardiopsis terrae TaxID=372655 RepID=A0ABR9HM70_9ACTN|nr:TetR/AcrR family transcriptional regulator [Nocardiopsis terrae]MBE1460100.1 AcrR family transcriptional regulator [Nocardiopsis terrae]GHC69693.1 TetR family transcriptional regulator [Nocardiopsis terrae]